MITEAVLKRVFPFLVLLLLGVVVYFQARGLTELLSLALGLETGVVDLAPSARAPERSKEPKSALAVLARNPFDSTTGPLLPRESSNPLAALPVDPLVWPDCQGVQVVIVSESRDPWWSLTSVREPGQQQARLRRVGDRVAGMQLAFIGYNPRQQAPAIWLEGSGGSCQSVLLRPALLTPVAIAAPIEALRSVKVVPEHLVRAGTPLDLTLNIN